MYVDTSGGGGAGDDEQLLVQGEDEGVPPAQGRDWACVRVQRDGRNEPVVHEPGQRRLAVERVFPSEPDEGWVALDPAVGGALVPRVVNRRLHLEVTASVLRRPVEHLLLLITVVIVVLRSRAPTSPKVGNFPTSFRRQDG